MIGTPFFFRKAGLPVLAAAFGLLLLACSVSAAPTLSVGSAQVSGAGDTATVDLVLDRADTGLAGYNVTVSVADPSVGTITDIAFPAWSALHANTTMPSGSVTYTTLDLMNTVRAGNTAVPLGTVTIRGRSAGSTRVTVTINQMSADGGANIWPAVIPGTFTVGSGSSGKAVPLALPGIGAVPRDPDGDGLYEDINGDGKVDFTDVSLYYQNWHWIQSSEPVALFDYNHNGIIDFEDIVLLNQKLA